MGKVSEGNISKILYQITANLMGDDGDRWEEEALKFIAGRNTWDGISDLCTIKIGTHAHTKELINIFESMGVFSWPGVNTEEAEKRVNSIHVSGGIIELDLITVRPRDLGLGNQSYYDWKTICGAAASRGLIVCPEESVLQICLQCGDVSKHSLYVFTQLYFSENPFDYSDIWEYALAIGTGDKPYIRPMGEECLLAEYAKCVFIRAYRMLIDS